MKLSILLFSTCLAFGQSTAVTPTQPLSKGQARALQEAYANQKSQDADPITEHLRAEVAVAQRNALVAQRQYEQAMTALQTKIVEAQKACGEVQFDQQSLVCTEKPK